MSIVSQKIKVENGFSRTVDIFFKKFHISSMLKEANAYKEKGIPCVQVFKVLFTLDFTGKNLFMNYEAENSPIPFARKKLYLFVTEETRVNGLP
ncbi:hypothetical protein [Thermotalea metallivorans]|uniref:Uncharacterized protein n=1 Tax=Thermotalea metallivorans TaxID=520762 RepID=A0A140L055_9FIRM|nr:hypothetical protein [Thermotalea metallivorans]KXG73930.1 hypothetical protein AN619_28520 [Thermotalea metallivorans]